MLCKYLSLALADNSININSTIYLCFNIHFPD